MCQVLRSNCGMRSHNMYVPAVPQLPAVPVVLQLKLLELQHRYHGLPRNAHLSDSPRQRSFGDCTAIPFHQCNAAF